MGDYHGNTVDRRVVRTQQLIAEAFLSLCADKAFGDIIVKDITERANVNRSTFYAHYKDKEHLLNTMIYEKLKELANLTGDLSGEASSYRSDFDRSDPYFNALFKHLAENRTFYAIMLGKIHPGLFSDKMQEVIRESFYKRIKNISNDQKLLIPMDVLLDYIGSSIHGLVSKWISQKMIYSPEHMSLQLTRLSMLGIYRAMGLSEHI